ncbi:MAG: aminodeoxychorismate synthase component I [Rubritalea sp.]|uniref:aminodeoxychorismate synthase component I n=1 Tax=Rubritalea sp. TaxID=2109375 RepID=UPI003241BFBF
MPQMTELDIPLHPSSVAAGLQHLDGLVFFDSSGNFPDGVDGVISVVAARPSEVLRGHITDVSAIAEVLAKYGTESGDLPNGGLCGWIEYEGSFCFGVYSEMLVYRHSSEQWYEIGKLSNEILPSPSAPLLQIGEFSQSMERADYLEKVGVIKEYISAGDIYQVNLAQKFSAKVTGESAFGLYTHLRELSPAPHSSYMALGGRELLSSSPETFLRFDQDRILTRPIKGTRPRFDDPAADQRSVFELRNSDKEVSELVMITDLERNDLGQVCDFGSVEVEALLKLEKFEHVYHLVSTVSGRLRKNGNQVRALQSCFPGGSITGAPKKRAMEIIEELEEHPRGLYTGAMGYFGFNGQSQFNIVIRTMVREGAQLHYHVGAGIVADSVADAEYEETIHKAKGMRIAVEQYLRKK